MYYRVSKQFLPCIIVCGTLNIEKKTCLEKSAQVVLNSKSRSKFSVPDKQIVALLHWEYNFGGDDETFVENSKERIEGKKQKDDEDLRREDEES